MKNRKLKNLARRVTALLLAAATVLPVGLLTRPAQAAVMNTTNTKIVVWQWIDDMQSIASGADYDPADNLRNIPVRDTKYSRILFYTGLDGSDYYFNASPDGGTDPGYFSNYKEDEIYLDEQSRIWDSANDEWNSDLYAAAQTKGSFFTMGTGLRTPYIQYVEEKAQVRTDFYDGRTQVYLGGHAWRLWVANKDDTWSNYALLQINDYEKLDVRRTDGYGRPWAYTHWGADNKQFRADPWIINKRTHIVPASTYKDFTNHVIWHWDNDSGGYDESLDITSGRKFYADQVDTVNTDEFKIFLGKEYNIGQLGADFTVQQDQNQSLKGIYYIPEGRSITVARDGVLSIEGTLLNDGKIYVEDGGLLVLKDGACIVPCSKTKKNCGGITSSGTVIVESNALLCGGGIDGLKILGGVVVNFGVLAAESMTLSRAYSIDNRDTGWIIAGRSPNITTRAKLVTNALNKIHFDFSNPDGYFDKVTKSFNSQYSIQKDAIYGNTANVRYYGDKVFGSPAEPLMTIYTRSTGTEPEVPLFEDVPVEKVSMAVTDAGVVYTVGDTVYPAIKNKLISMAISRGGKTKEKVFKDKWYGEAGLDDAYITLSPAYAPTYNLDIQDKFTSTYGPAQTGGGSMREDPIHVFPAANAEADLWHIKKAGQAYYNNKLTDYYTLESCYHEARDKSLDYENFNGGEPCAGISGSYPSSEDQQWFFIKDGDYYRIVSRHNPKYCLGVWPHLWKTDKRVFRTEFGTVEPSACRWFVSNTFSELGYDTAVDVGTGVEFLPQSEENLALSVDGGAIRTSRSGELPQRWRLEAAGTDILDGEVKPFYTIVERNTGKALAVSGNDIRDGVKLAAVSPGGTEPQHWYVNDVLGGEYAQIAARGNSEFVLSSNGWGIETTLSVNVNAKSQRWKVKGVKHDAASVNASMNDPFNNQTFTIAPKSAPKLNLGVQNDGKGNGSRIEMRNAVASSLAQQWTFKYLGTADLNGTETPYYMIENVNAGKALDSSGAASDAQPHLWESNMTNGNQQWYVVSAGDDAYTIIPRANPANCLDVAGNGKTAGTAVKTYALNGGDNQKWVLTEAVDEEDLNGKVVTISPSHATNMSLDFTERSTDNGIRMGIRKSVENESQRWKLVRRGSTFINGRRQSYYTIESCYARGKALDNAASTANGTQATIWDTNPTNKNQLWFIRAEGDGTYRIIPRSDATKNLGVTGSQKTDNSPVILYDIVANVADQKWKLTETVDIKVLGTYELLPVAAPNYEVDVAQSGNRGNVYLYSTHQANYTRWQFVQMGEDDRGPYYKIVNQGEGRVLAVNGEPANGVQAIMYDFEGGADQFWYLDSEGSDAFGEYYTITLRFNDKLRLGVQNSAYRNGTSMITTTDRGKNTYFYLSEEVPATSLGVYEFGGCALVDGRMEVAGRSTASGANVQIYARNGFASQNADTDNPHQQWKIILRGYSIKDGVKTPYVSIENVQSGLTLDLPGRAEAAAVNLANISQVAYDGYSDQHWFIEPQSDGTVTFRNRANEKLYLWPDGGGSNSNVRVALEGNEYYRRWYLHPVPGWDGGFVFKANPAAVEAGIPTAFATDYRVSVHANGQYNIVPQHGQDLRIDLPNGYTDGNNIVHLWAEAGNVNQKWIVTPMGVDFFDGDGTGHIYYKICYAGRTSKVLQCEGTGPVAANLNYYIADYEGTYDDFWYLEPVGSSDNGTIFNIIGRGTLSSGSICIEAPGGKGLDAYLKTNVLGKNQAHQQWTFRPRS